MKSHLALLRGSLAAAAVLHSAGLSAAPDTSPWHGFERSSFAIDGHAAFVTRPKIAAPGKPWVWRTSFPDFHAEVDRELLAQGWHVAFVDCVDLLGCDQALDVYDRFYEQTRRDFGLAAKPALEAVSRGGLHAYRYAARHPDRVACIYADTPVMDLKSWPLEWPDAKAQLAQALRCYGFADEAALRAWKGNPVDLLAPIAKARIPLRHVISLNDMVVPPERNTLEAKRRLEALGHTMDLVALPEGTAESNGHHFPLPEVFQSARFIMRHTAELPKGREYFTLREGLANCRAKFETGKTGRIAFLGGSITFNPGWRDELMRYFQQKFPDTSFDFIAAGIPSVGSLGHAFRLHRDVLHRGPVDLIFVEAAVNDHNYDGWGEPQARKFALRGMEGVVRQLRALNPQTDIVQMHFIHNGAHLPVYARGGVPHTIDEHEKVAAHYGNVSLNLSQEVADRIAAGQFTWNDDFKDLHPSPYGQRVYANSMTRMLEAAFAMDRKPSPHALPAEPLDPASFAHGRYGRLEDAQLVRGFSLDPKWQPSVRQPTRAGFVKCPALVAEQPGAELRYTFEGTGFGLFLAAGKDTGVIEYSFDNGPPRTLDTWATHSHALHLPWPLILADDLKPGKHTVTIRTTDQNPERTALHIIHVLLN